MCTGPVVKTFVAGVIILGLATACTPEQFRNVLNVTHPDKAVVTITETQSVVGPVDPPQRLDEVMVKSSSAIQRCNDSGGEPIWYPFVPNLIVCEGIDY